MGSAFVFSEGNTVKDTSHRRELGTLAQGAKALGCSPRTIRRYIAAGTLTGYRVGPRNLRVDMAEVEALARPIPAASGEAA